MLIGTKNIIVAMEAETEPDLNISEHFSLNPGLFLIDVKCKDTLRNSLINIYICWVFTLLCPKKSDCIYTANHDLTGSKLFFPLSFSLSLSNFNIKWYIFIPPSPSPIDIAIRTSWRDNDYSETFNWFIVHIVLSLTMRRISC